MNILHVVDSLDRGGLEKFVANLAIEQRTQGHNAEVFGIAPATGFAEQLHEAGVPVHEGRPGKKGWVIPRQLAALCRQRGVDCIHAHGYVPAWYSACAALINRAAPVRICTVHDMGTRLSGKILRTKFRWAMRGTHCLVAVGQQVAAAMVDHDVAPASKISVIYNGITPPDANALAQLRTQMRSDLALTDDDVLVGTVGRQVPLKNQHVLIDAISNCNRTLARPLQLLLVGDGPLRESLHSHAAKLGVTAQVHFAGEVADAQGHLAAMDIFALPSDTEGLSMALLEAAATAVAAVATDVGGNAEIIEHGKTGLLLKPRGPGSQSGRQPDAQTEMQPEMQPEGQTRTPDDALADRLAEALLALAQDPTHRRQLGGAARQWVYRCASIDAASSQYMNAYEQALRSN